jgi:predicted transport protein
MLGELGWDIRDPDDVELEYPTIDAKSVDYALKINGKCVALLEAKPLTDPLDDVKAITQVVGYAANDGIEWCILTNGIRYKVYKSSERAAAPDKLLFEVSFDPRDAQRLSVEQINTQLNRISKESLAHGTLDRLGEEIFTATKIRKALDRLFANPPGALIRVIRTTVEDENITPAQIRDTLARIWRGDAEGHLPVAPDTHGGSKRVKKGGERRGRDYGEAHHIEGKPKEVVELYRALDRLCQDLAPGLVKRGYLAKYVGWSIGKRTFCSAHLQQSGLRVWIRFDPAKIPESATYARDVSKIGHWGVGNVELAIDSLERLHDAERYIRTSFYATPREEAI